MNPFLASLTVVIVVEIKNVFYQYQVQDDTFKEIENIEYFTNTLFHSSEIDISDYDRDFIIEQYENWTVLVEDNDPHKLILETIALFDKIKNSMISFYLDMDQFNHENDTIYIVCHNGYRFDFKYFYDTMITFYGGRVNGSFDNLKSIQAGTYKFIDSSTLLQASLKKLCQSFNVPIDISKMDYDFNERTENNYFKW